MEEKAKKALQESIEHWQNIVSGEDYYFCSLCGEFSGNSCKGCPIYSKTGHMNCENTPWEEFKRHITEEHKPYVNDFTTRIYCPECKRLAQKEVDFLKSLVQKEKKKYYLKIENPEVAIGENRICIIVVDENGIEIPQEHLIDITTEGTLSRIGFFNQEYSLDVGIQVEGNNKIIVDCY